MTTGLDSGRPNGRNGFNERERLSDAVAAGTDEDQRERDALGFGHEVEL